MLLHTPAPVLLNVVPTLGLKVNVGWFSVIASLKVTATAILPGASDSLIDKSLTTTPVTVGLARSIPNSIAGV